MLALAGIGAAVMFSGYSQILRSNAEMTAINAARSQLQSAGQTLSASSVLDSATSSIVQPPAIYSAATVALSSDAPRLPNNYGNAGNTGTPHDVGVIDVSSGVRQLDPWGKYYIYCRWENPVSTPSAPSLMVISAGPDGNLDTKCGDTTAQGDDRIITSTVAETINRANVWQVSSSSQVKFGLDSNAVRVNQDGSLLAASLLVTEPAAGVATPIILKDKNGTTVFTVSDAGAVSATSFAATSGTFTTISVAGVAGIGAANITGGVTVGSTLGVTGATTLTGALTANGGIGTTTLTTSGLATLNSLSAGASGLGNTQVTGTLGVSGATTLAGLTAGTTSLGATTISALTLTTPLAITQGGTGANTAAGARTALGLGTMAVQDASNVNITGGTISGVTISGGSISGGSVSGNIAGHAALDLAIANNLSDVNNAATARSNIGANNASNLTSGTLSALLLPASGVTAGTYNQVTVDGTGRVTLGANTTASQWTTSGSDISYSTGNVGIGTVAGTQRLSVNGDVIIQGAAGTTRNLFYGTDTSKRWAILTNATAEAGSNAGSDLVISSFKDDGTALANVFSITRASSAAAFAGSVTAPTFYGTLVGSVSSSGPISLSDGSAAVPGLYFTSDTNTGIYRPGADVLGIAAGGNDVARFVGGTSNVNYFSIAASATGVIPNIAVAGSDTDISIALSPKGAGTVNLGGSLANYVAVNGAATTVAPTIAAAGSDTNVGLSVAPKGTGVINLGNNLANYITINGAATTFAPVISAAGADTNVGITLTPKGAGNTIISTGDLGIGTATPGSLLDVQQTRTDTAAGTQSLLNEALTITPGSASSTDFIGNNVAVTITAQGANSITGIKSIATNNAASATVASGYGSFNEYNNSLGKTTTTVYGTFNEMLSRGTATNGYGAYNYILNSLGTLTTAIGTENYISHSSSHALSMAYASENQISNIQNITVAAAVHSTFSNSLGGTIGTYYGLLVDGVNNSSTISNWYGLYINSVAGTITSGYPIYVADTHASYFAGGANLAVLSGSVGIGTATANHLLDVNGNIGVATSGYINFSALDGTGGYGIRDNGGNIEIKNSGGTWGPPGGGVSTQFNAGSAGAPGFAVVGDSDTGFFQATANTVSVATGGVETARFLTTASAVDYMTFAPGAAGTPGVVTIGAAGSDTDVNIALTPKGVGVVKANAPVNVVAGTTTTSAPNISSTQTWNAGGVTFTGILQNITDTASAAASLLMDLQVGGASKFSVNKAGNIVNAGSIAATGAITGSNLSGTNTGDQTITLTGDVTGSGTGSFAASIASGHVTNAMLAGSIALSKLSTTGTPDTTTVLRGDGAWTAITSLVTGFAAGTVSAPGWAVTTDTDTGIWEPTANTLSTAAGGVEVLRLNTVASGVDYFAMTPSATGSPGAITLAAAGSDTDVSIVITPKGAGGITTSGAAGTQISATTSNTGSSTTAVSGVASGSTTNITYGGIFQSASSNGVGVYGNASTSGAGSSIGGLFATGTNGGVALKAVSGNASAVGFVVQGAVSQTGDLAEFQNSSGTILAKVDSSGYIAEQASGYINFGSTTGTSGYGLFDNGGTLQYKNSGGSWTNFGGGTFAAGTVSAPGWAVTGDTDTGLWEPTANTLSTAAGGVEVLRLNTIASGVDYFTMTPSATGSPGSITIGAAGSDTDVGIVLSPKGAGGITTSGSALYQVSSTTSNFDGIAVYGYTTSTGGDGYGGYFRAAGSSSIGVYGWASKTSGSTVGGSFQSDSTGGIGVQGLAAGTTGSNYGGYFQSNSTSGTSLYAIAGNAATKGLVVQGAASQTGDLAEFKNSSGTVLSSIASDGALTISSLSGGGAAVSATSTAGSGTSYALFGSALGSGGVGVRGTASSATGTTYGGKFYSGSSSGIGLYTQVGNAAGIPFVAQGAASQTGDLAEFQNSSGTVQAKIDASGYIAEQASGYINFGLTTGTSGYGLFDNGGTLQYKNSGGSWTNLGGGTPGGSTTQVQFNSSGAFSGDSGFTYAGSGAVTLTTSLTDPLHIGGTGASSTLTLESTSGTGTSDAIIFKTGSQAEVMRITTGGLVGIGTSSPSVRLGQKLDVATSANYGGMALSTWSAASTDHQSILDFNRSKSSTFGTYTAVASNDSLGGMVFRGSDGTAFVNSSTIIGYVDGTVATSQIPGRLVFSTASSAGTLTERVRIDSSGNVGIGTATVNTIASQTGITGARFINMYDNTASEDLRLAIQGNNSAKIDMVHLGAGTDAKWMQIYNANGALTFRSVNDTGSAFATNNILVLQNSNGNVGIGTASPGHKLDVGDGSAATDLYVYGNVTGSKNSYVRMADRSGSAIGFAAVVGGTTTLNLEGGSGVSYFNGGGNVGIGTTSPNYTLDIIGQVAVGPIYNTGGSTPSKVIFKQANLAQPSYTNDSNGYVNYYADPTGGTYIRSLDLVSGSVNTASRIKFFTSTGSSGVPTEAMRIDSTGYVGIGTTSPNATLDVHADINGAGSSWTTGQLMASGATSSAKRTVLGYDTTLNEGFIQPYNNGSGYSNLLLVPQSGNVGIGTTSPNHKLDVNGNIGLAASSYINFGATDGTSGYGIFDNGGTLQYKNSGGSWTNLSGGTQWTTTGSNIYYSTGNVGIGLTGPGAPLEIRGTSAGYASNAGNLALTTAGSTNGLRFGVYDSNYAWISSFNSLPLYLNAGGNNVIMNASGGNVGIGATSYYGKLSIGNNSADGTGDPSQGLVFTDTTSGVGNTWSGSAIYNVGSGGFRGNLVFATNNAGSQGNTLTEQMRILADGNVGINTTSPGAKLDINVASTNGSPTTALRLSEAGTAWGGSGSSIDFYNQDNGAVNLAARIGSWLTGGGANSQTSDLVFYTTSSGSDTEKMRIQGGGNVGIGNTSPGYKLDVSGMIGAGAVANNNYFSGVGSTICLETGGACTAGAGTPQITEDWGVTLVGNGGTQPVRVLNAALLVGYGNQGTSYPSGNLLVSGNVGIGTASPATLLQLEASSSPFLTFSVSGTQRSLYGIATSTGSASDIAAVNDTVLRSSQGANLILESRDGAGNHGNIYLTTGNGDTAKVTILNGGNVGIGTTSPGYLLDVVNASSVAQGHFSGSGADNGLYLMGLSSGGWVTGNSYFNGTSWVAKATNAQIVGMGGGSNNISFFTDTGLTAGSTYTPTNRMIIDSSGNVNIGTSGQAYKLYVNGTSRLNGNTVIVGTLAVIGVANSAGDSYVCNNTGTGYWSWNSAGCNVSDVRLKKNIKTLEDPLDKIAQLRGVTFDWKTETKAHHGPQIGFIAQEVEKVFPSVVATGSDGFKSVGYDKLVSPLVEGVKALKKMFDALADDVKKLAARVDEVFTRLASHDNAIEALRKQLAHDDNEIALLKEEMAGFRAAPAH
jgi:hypothetical protein